MGGGSFFYVGIGWCDGYPAKPKCYDNVPACLCMNCQLYDVKQMVSAKSSIVSSRSPFLPRYAASLLSRPSVKSAPCVVSSALSSRPSCSVAEYTSGLADVDVPMFLSRPRLDFADLSSPSFVPACDPPPPVSSVPPVCAVSAPPVRVVPAQPVDSVAVPPVCSSVPVAAPPVLAPPSTVAASPVCSVSSVASHPVYVPPVAPSSSVAAPPGFRPAFVSPSSVGSVPPPVHSVPHCPVRLLSRCVLPFSSPVVPRRSVDHVCLSRVLFWLLFLSCSPRRLVSSCRFCLFCVEFVWSWTVWPVLLFVFGLGLFCCILVAILFL